MVPTMSSAAQFSGDLLSTVLSHLDQLHPDNYDDERFGRLKPRKLTLGDRVRHLAVKGVEASFPSVYYRSKTRRYGHAQGLYSALADAESKRLLLMLLAYRILGRERVRLPVDLPDRERLRRLIDTTHKGAASSGWQLELFDLKHLGYDVRLLSTVGGVSTIFAQKQYEYEGGGASIRAEPDDVVIDAGGCWGDSALYFAHCVGPRGRVFTFEFLPGNLEVLRTNLQYNEQLRGRIEVVEKPLWDRSGEELFVSGKGPGSRVSPAPSGPADARVSTVAIDDFVREHDVPRVDLIKMDIEGAELKALEGAAETITTFRPKLAISVYHRLSDLADIPAFILDLEPGYGLHLGHYTIHCEETVLYAVPPQDQNG